jgi:hypothetical protein
MIGIGQTFGDNALEVRIDHGAVKRPPLTDDAVGERDPALGWAFGGWAGCWRPAVSHRRNKIFHQASNMRLMAFEIP